MVVFIGLNETKLRTSGVPIDAAAISILYLLCAIGMNYKRKIAPSCVCLHKDVCSTKYLSKPVKFDIDYSLSEYYSLLRSKRFFFQSFSKCNRQASLLSIM